MATDVVKPNDFKSRNRFLAFVVFIMGLVQFSSNVRSAQDDVALELLSASAFFAMLGASLVLILLTVNPHDLLSTFVTIIILSVAAVMYISTAIYIADSSKECDRKPGCGAKAFAESPLIAAYACIVIGIDLFDQYFQQRRLRVITNSCIILLTCMLMFIYFDKLGHDDLNHSSKTALAGFAFLFTAAFISLSVIGIAGMYGIKILNVLISLIFYLGLLLVLAYSDMTSSSILVWWFLLSATVYLIAADVQAGGEFNIQIQSYQKN